jgi:hypothetical protein
MGVGWSVRLPMSPPDEPAKACTDDALLDLVLAAGERILELAASPDRSAQLQELATLAADLDLFARAASKAVYYR